MKPTLDQLATGILHVGYEDPGIYPLSEIPFDVWKVLQERGRVERGPNGEPVLTAKGQKAFTGLEASIDMRKFDYAGEEEQPPPLLHCPMGPSGLRRQTQMLDILRSFFNTFGFVEFIWRGLRTLFGYPPDKCGETLMTGSNIAAAVFVAALAATMLANLLLQ